MATEPTEVVVKGEIHTSESDLDEERELLTEGIDALVIESDREDAEYGILRSWYATAMGLVGLIFFKILYTDHRILVDLAEAQDAAVIPTRESDADLIENAHPAVELMAAILFYGIFLFSVYYGLRTGNTLHGAIYLLGSAILPIGILRWHEMHRRDDEVNRDQIIADRVAGAAEDGGRVVAVVGERHLDSVAEKLPNDIEPEKIEPVYSKYSLQHAKEVFTPAFTAWSVLFVLYLVILEFFRWFPLINV